VAVGASVFEVYLVGDARRLERMSRLRRFLPPQVADLIVASGSEKHRA
jgi:hypothetical protein